jgi:hypothetical protein
VPWAGALGYPLEQRQRLGRQTMGGVDDHADDVGVPCPAPRARHHGAIQPSAWGEQPRRVDQNNLGAAIDCDSAQQRTGGLCLWGHDRDLGADQRVDEGRLADVGRADQRNKPAARVLIHRWKRLPRAP